MQYFGKAIGTVSRTWNSLNPSTLSGAIDVVVIRQTNGDYHCSAFHIRFGKISLLRPSEKIVDFYVNGEKIYVPMKLGEGGEAFFVFATNADVPESLLTSPVVSPVSSPSAPGNESGDNADIDFLDISKNNDKEGNKSSSHSSPRESNATVSHDQQKEQLEEQEQQESQAQQDDLSPEMGNTDTLEPRLRDQQPSRIDEIIKRLQEIKIPSTHKDNGSVIMDATGYKAGGQNTKELEKVVSNLLNEDGDSGPESPPSSPPQFHKQNTTTFDNVHIDDKNGKFGERPQHFVKTLRLSSDILKSLNLKPGKNDMKFVVRSNGASVSANIFLWDSMTPVVISDIDGTITKSDAMGHIMTFVGRDWTHAGVGRLFSDIFKNGYNIMYLTSRSVGLADGTRGYLQSIDQDGVKLPPGPVILSPDRTMAALRREVIMRKPEIFKMACLRDIQKLYEYDFEADMTPFYAGFGNRITDALSYRSVGVPSTKIFTIDTDSEVKLELLELTGIKSSYILITDLVDQLFPPISTDESEQMHMTSLEFSDAMFWKTPVAELSDDEDNVQSITDPSIGNATTSRLDWKNKFSATFSDDEGDFDSEEDSSDSEESD